MGVDKEEVQGLSPVPSTFRSRGDEERPTEELEQPGRWETWDSRVLSQGAQLSAAWRPMETQECLQSNG